MIRELRKGDRRVDVTCFFEELLLPGVRKAAVSKGFKRLFGELIRWEWQIMKFATAAPAYESTSDTLATCAKLRRVFRRHKEKA
jgi:hypothetical protein